MNLFCKCGSRIRSQKGLSEHVKLCHYLDENDNLFDCVLQDCVHTPIRNENNIPRHFRTHHNYDDRFKFLDNYAGPNPFLKLINHRVLQQINLPEANENENYDDYDIHSELGDDIEMEENGYPKLVSSIQNSSANILSQKIVNHKSRYNLSEVASLSIAEDWRLYYLNEFEKANIFLILN